LNHKQLKHALKGYSLVAFKQDEFFFSSLQRGITPLVALCEKNAARDELSLADKVIGKAAALLCVRCGVKTLYAKVLSEEALAVLEASDINTEYEELVPYIENRSGDGKCPMESLAQGVQSPEQMLARVQQFLKELNISANC
jgi:hypothetical protein